MNVLKKIYRCLLLAAALAGCKSTDRPPPLRSGEVVLLSEFFDDRQRPNDGLSGPFPVASKIDDIFFLVEGPNVHLLIDDVVLVATPPPAPPATESAE